MLLYYLSLLDTQEERDKFTLLYETHKRAMMVAARNVLKSSMQAEDAVHEAFLKLTRNMDSVGDVDAHETKSYLCCAARRCALDIIKKNNRHLTVSMETVCEIQAGTVDMLSGLEKEDMLTLIKELPVNYQDVLELKAYQELSDKEIAAFLGISCPAARKRLERARGMLLDRMQRRGGNYVYS